MATPPLEDLVRYMTLAIAGFTICALKPRCASTREAIVRLANCRQAHTRRLSLKFTIQVLIESLEALALSVPVQTIERNCGRIEDVGLRLEEAKAILIGLQEQLVREQLAKHLQSHRPCPSCRRPRNIKGYHSLRFRSAFGDLRLRGPAGCGAPAKIRQPRPATAR